ncbi:hypothetical protein TRFO_01319 [Tritrichomonas foetus]|uniref:SAC domain-containing protein n=1 Tax=Tritrichomonas foetus TaxID=1144522 RepID=A0A1J4K731_9EUKA|nr:hypothetical protein TRFO_01319 [Tritrichomonas foetus]|eukprot:OHT07183.1 hypothetical protein TRFO_01319 [Tritrichomonas foetus]
MKFEPSSEVYIYKTDGFGVLLLVKKPTDKKYYMFQINTLNGSFSFDGIEGSSIFQNKQDATKYIQENYTLLSKEPVTGQALVGAARYGQILYLLIIKSSIPVARIQNAHTIFSVSGAEFYKIELPFHQALTAREARRIERIKQFPVEEHHMWRETTDLTKPLFLNSINETIDTQNNKENKDKENNNKESNDKENNELENNDKENNDKENNELENNDKENNDKENNELENNDKESNDNQLNENQSFYWNEYWTKTFDDLGQKDVCIKMLQGTATSQMIPLGEPKQLYRFSMITIREATNGGTRYYARGIDDNHHPANEVQCHLIVESNDGRLWSNVWRRGSVPVKWSTVIAKNLPTVSISILPNCDENTKEYFEEILQMFPNGVLCLNLLHNQPGNSELPLCNAYKNAVKDIDHVDYKEFDWHHTVKEKMLSGAVEELYKNLPKVEISYSQSEDALPIGQIDPSFLNNSSTSNSSSTNSTNLPLSSRSSPNHLNNTTNSALSNSNINLMSSSTNSTKRSILPNVSRNFSYRASVSLNQNPVIHPNVSFSFSNEETLPEIGKTFTEKQTSTIRINCMDSLDRTNVVCFFYAAKVLSLILEQIGDGKEINDYTDLMAIPQNIRMFLCDAFMSIGDCISFLYTNTPACMTETFHEVAQSGLKSKRDSAIAVQRRYHNFLTDKKRQKSYMLFNGKNFETLIPNVNCGTLPTSVSMPPARFIPPYPNKFDPSSLLQLSENYINLPGPKSKLTLLLSDYCYVSDVYIVASPPYIPLTVSISYSLTLGTSIPLVRKVAFPQVNIGTPLHIKIPPEFTNDRNLVMRYLIFEFKTNAARKDMSIGNIFVFGEKTVNHEDIQNYYNFTYQDLPIKPLFKSSTEKSANDILPTYGSIDDCVNKFSQNENTKIAQNTQLENLLKGITKIDFSGFINYELTRMLHNIGRLKSLSIAAKNGLNPLDFTYTNLRARIPNLTVNNTLKCIKCKSTATWKCVMCLKSFCSDTKCSSFNTFDDSFYFKGSIVVCDECAVVIESKKNELENLALGYESIAFMQNEEANKINNFVLPFLEMKENNPCKFPKAFFNDVKDPNYNLLLTDKGWEISAEKWESPATMCLGCGMKIESITVKGSSDCLLQFSNNSGSISLDLKPGIQYLIQKQEPKEPKNETKEGEIETKPELLKNKDENAQEDLQNCQETPENESQIKDVRIDPKEKEAEKSDAKRNEEKTSSNKNAKQFNVALTGRAFRLTLKAGTLNSILVHGTPTSHLKFQRNKFITSSTKFTPKRAKSTPLTFTKALTAELPKNNPILGMILQEFSGIRSILVKVFRIGDIKPSRVFYYYLPEMMGDQFIVLFKRQIDAAKIEIQVIDASQFIKDPKVLLI